MVRRQRGVSLIELTITVAVMSTMLMLGAPLTQGWVNSTRAQDAQGLLAQGIAQAKALALRNAGGVGSAGAAATLCIDSTSVRVFSALPCSSTNDPEWQATLPDNVSIVDSTDEAVDCLAFNNRGLPVEGADDCPTPDNVTIGVGGKHASLPIY